MISSLVVSCLEFFTSLVNLLPQLDVGTGFLENVSSGIPTLREFIKAANFIVPLDDFALILGIDIGIRVFNITLFFGNWILNKIAAVIP